MLVTIALDAIGFGMIIPVEPQLVMRIGHVSGAAASFWLGAILATFSGALFLSAPMLGGLSDRFGRRPVMLLSVAMQGSAALATVFVPNLWLFFVLRAIAGASSGNISAATAYLADISTPEQRAQRFGLVGAMFGLGFVLGPAFGGLLGTVSIRLPFLIRAILAGCNLVYGFIVLRESLPPERRRPFNWRQANAFGALRGVTLDRAAQRLGIVWCCLWFALGAQQSCFILANQMRFHWNSWQNGLVLALAGAASALTQGLLVGRVRRRLGLRRTALVGIGLSALGYLTYSLALRSWMMFPGAVILALGALANPAVQSMFSGLGGRGHGETQGALSSLAGLMAIVAPLTMGGIFSFATRPGAPLHFAGAPFLLAALICAGGAVVLARGATPAG